MTLNQEEIKNYLHNDISNFVKLQYKKSLFVINEIKAVILPDRKNYQSTPYKFLIVFRYHGKNFKVTVEHYIQDENVKYGLQFNQDVDYGEESTSIAEFYGYILTSQKLIKNVLNSVKLPS